MAIRVLYFGTPAFSVPPLKQLLADPTFQVCAVVTQPDRPAGRGKRLSPSPVKSAALEAQIPIFQPEKLQKEWNELQPKLPMVDIGVVCAFGQILPKDTLNFPTYGSLNIHASLLPRWRGAAPLQRAILAGDRETGVSLMRMEEGLDTGPWYIQQRVPITESTDTGELHDRLAQVGGELLVNNLQRILSGELQEHPQDEQQVTYAKKITKKDASISWDLPAVEVSRQIRAFSPHPGAFTFLNGKRLKIFKGRPIEPLTNKKRGTPGSIYRVTENKIEVNCSQSILLVEELQLEGKEKLSSNNFLTGVPLHEGQQLAPAQ